MRFLGACGFKRFFIFMIVYGETPLRWASSLTPPLSMSQCSNSFKSNVRSIRLSWRTFLRLSSKKAQRIAPKAFFSVQNCVCGENDEPFGQTEKVSE